MASSNKSERVRIVTRYMNPPKPKEEGIVKKIFVNSFPIIVGGLLTLGGTFVSQRYTASLSETRERQQQKSEERSRITSIAQDVYIFYGAIQGDLMSQSFDSSRYTKTDETRLDFFVHFYLPEIHKKQFDEIKVAYYFLIALRSEGLDEAFRKKMVEMAKNIYEAKENLTKQNLLKDEND